MPATLWPAIEELEQIPSPSLVVFPERIKENIARMIRIAGSAERLRPHIKTHKMSEVVRLHLQQGIKKFKCATIAEAEMALRAGAPDLLLAFQPVGPNIYRLLQLTKVFPEATISTIVDDPLVARELSNVFSRARLGIRVFVDIDCGMNRSGIPANKAALDLCRLIAALPGLVFRGLHVYDGHIHDGDLSLRTRLCADAFAPVAPLVEELSALGLSGTVVAGGTPTFPIHAQNRAFECSPGTCVLWDFGYHDKFADLDFLVAALLLTRVVSKPGGNRLCLDLGHKAIASENPPPRVRLLGLEDAKAITHSEEHLVVESERAPEIPIGQPFFGIPRHICPTVALYSQAAVVQESRVVSSWKIEARARVLTI